MANRATHWLPADVARAAGIRRREVLGWIARGRIPPCGVAVLDAGKGA